MEKTNKTRSWRHSGHFCFFESICYVYWIPFIFDGRHHTCQIWMWHLIGNKSVKRRKTSVVLNQYMAPNSKYVGDECPRPSSSGMQKMWKSFLVNYAHTVFNQLWYPSPNLSRDIYPKNNPAKFQKDLKIFLEWSRGQTWSYGWMDRRTDRRTGTGNEIFGLMAEV